jgi:hypothetical protein
MGQTDKKHFFKSFRANSIADFVHTESLLTFSHLRRVHNTLPQKQALCGIHLLCSNFNLNFSLKFTIIPTTTTTTTTSK